MGKKETITSDFVAKRLLLPGGRKTNLFLIHLVADGRPGQAIGGVMLLPKTVLAFSGQSSLIHDSPDTVVKESQEFVYAPTMHEALEKLRPTLLARMSRSKTYRQLAMPV